MFLFGFNLRSVSFRLLIADYHEVCTGYAFRLTGMLNLRQGVKKKSDELHDFFVQWVKRMIKSAISSLFSFCQIRNGMHFLSYYFLCLLIAFFMFL